MSYTKSLEELEWAENYLELTDEQKKTLEEKRRYILDTLHEIDCVDIAQYRESKEKK